MITALIVFVLILLNGLFVAAEFAIVGAPRIAIERRAARGNRTARRVHRILTEPRQQARFIATAQLGITLASLGLGMYGEHTLALWLEDVFAGFGELAWLPAHALASVLAVGLLTYLHIVLGEMVPKSLALQYAERTVLAIVPVMLAIELALYPLVVALNAIGNGFLRLFGIDRRAASTEHYYSTEELQYIIQESQEGGLLREESAGVLRELFEFNELDAGEVMVPRVRIRGIPDDADAEDVVEILRSSRHTRYPVYTGDLDHIVGYVHVRDLLQRVIAGAAFAPEDVHPLAYLPETSPADVVLQTMHEAQTEMVVVMDEHGGTAGIVVLEDLFEEVVGQIEEGVTAHPEVYLDPDGRLHAEGTVRVSEVGEQLGQVLEHEEVDTVSGLILALLNRPPVPGDAVVFDGVRFVVAAVEGHGVRECIVSVEPPHGPEKDEAEA